MKLLVTGSSGFIGSHIMEMTKEKGWETVGVVRASSIEAFTTPKTFPLQTLDVNTDWQGAFDNVDCVVHCAACVHLMEDVTLDPLLAFRNINTDATLNLARQAAAAGVKRFIFLSSIKVNGESTSNRFPFTAFDERLPEDPYAISKSEAEELLLELGNEAKMEIVIIRPPLVYGEGVKGNFASLMKLVSKGLPLPLRSISQNKRSLLSVYNLVDLIMVCIEHPRAANQVFLVSDDNDLSTAEIVALMAKAQGVVNLSLPLPLCLFKLAGKVFKKDAVVDRLIGSLQLDIEHTKKTLNWTPPYSVEHGFMQASKTFQINKTTITE